MPSYKLTYFDLPGRAEPIRLAFQIGGIPFTDERIKREDFPAKKDSYIFGCLPILEVDKTVLYSTAGILRYVGLLSGLYPQDPLEGAKVDTFVGVVDDIVIGITVSFKEPDEARGAAIRKELGDNRLPKMFAAIDKAAGSNGFCTGNKLSVADLFLYTVCQWIRSKKLDGIPADIPDRCANVKRICDTVAGNEKVAAWNKAHSQ
ncbi:MAG: glutathione S-transferase [Olpidium bornovanus]|uniref:Glutathione S-transferase n=1 Tax=Olpidium bornovanus TaxID=278681 RepID=A0A8H8DE54_9FUNG|nr:MAG: glutathione S-transferase [Olpidium bornovanus]